MKNIKTESEDTLRPEYTRSDFSELIRGKHATLQVDFHQLTGALLKCIGEDEGMKFTQHSTGNYMARHEPGDWTYEIDNSNQVTLRYWLSEFGNVEQAISNPPTATTPQDRSKLHDGLLQGVRNLMTKVGELSTQ